MPSYRDEVVVLRTQKLGEADRIVTLLTRWHGRVRAVAKGVRRTSSKFGARLEPFMVADAQLYIGRNLDVVQQVDTIGAYGTDIAVDYERYTAASAMAETADRLGDADATPQQYLLLVGGLRSLSRGEHAPREVMNSYLLRTMSLSGWAPSLDACARCGTPGPHDAFVAQLGGAVCANCAPTGASTIRPDVTRHLRALVQGDWETVEAATDGTTHASAGVITAYAQFHLERGIRSLAQVSAR